MDILLTNSVDAVADAGEIVTVLGEYGKGAESTRVIKVTLCVLPTVVGDGERVAPCIAPFYILE